MSTRAVWVAVTLALGLLGLPLVAVARQASLDEEVALSRGDTLRYPETLTRRGNRYVGGVAYTLVDASLEELSALFADTSAYVRVLPYAREARFVGHEGADRLVEVHQGNALVQAVYTLVLRTDEGSRRVRFWLDRSRPHGVADAWGFFRVEPLSAAADGAPRALVRFGALVDLGPGILRNFFEGRIQTGLLDVPGRLRLYAAQRFRSR